MKQTLSLPDTDVLLILAVMAALYHNKCDKSVLIAMGLLLVMISGV